MRYGHKIRKRDAYYICALCGETWDKDYMPFVPVEGKKVCHSCAQKYPNQNDMVLLIEKKEAKDREAKTT